jgi:hypothetical protein
MDSSSDSLEVNALNDFTSSLNERKKSEVSLLSSFFKEECKIVSIHFPLRNENDLTFNSFVKFFFN